MTQTELLNIETYVKDWHAAKFNGLADEDLRLWLGEVRDGLEERQVPQTFWVPVAFHFLGDEVRAVLGRVQQMMSEMESTKNGKKGVVWEWEWDTFSRALIHIHGEYSADEFVVRIFNCVPTEQVKKKASQNGASGLIVYSTCT